MLSPVPLTSSWFLSPNIFCALLLSLQTVAALFVALIPPLHVDSTLFPCFQQPPSTLLPECLHAFSLDLQFERLCSLLPISNDFLPFGLPASRMLDAGVQGAQERLSSLTSPLGKWLVTFQLPLAAKSPWRLVPQNVPYFKTIYMKSCEGIHNTHYRPSATNL